MWPANLTRPRSRALKTSCGYIYVHEFVPNASSTRGVSTTRRRRRLDAFPPSKSFGLPSALKEAISDDFYWMLWLLPVGMVGRSV